MGVPTFDPKQLESMDAARDGTARQGFARGTVRHQ